MCVLAVSNVCTNEAYIDEGQKMMMMVGCIRPIGWREMNVYREKTNDEERKEQDDVDDEKEKLKINGFSNDERSHRLEFELASLIV